MSLLTACNEASPGVSYFAPAGAGPGPGPGPVSTLQSPASITPAVDGTASFSVLATGAALASVQIGPGQVAGQSSSLTLRNGAPGTSLIQMDAVAITQNGFSGAITVSNVNTSVTPLIVDTVNNAVGIGSAGGTVSVGAPMTINAPTTITNGTNGISLTATSGTVSNIGQTVAQGGGLILGSSAACPAVLGCVDTIGSGSAFVSVANGGTVNLRLQGGATVGYTVPIIATSQANTGTLCLGASAVNPQTVFINDGATAGTGFVDITAGTSAGNAMRLTGGANASIASNGAGSTLSLSASPGTSSIIKISDTAATGTLRNTGIQLSDPPSSLPSSSGGSWSAYSVLGTVSGGYASPQNLNLSTLPDGAFFLASNTNGSAPTGSDLNVMFAMLVYIKNGALLGGGYSAGATNTYVITPTNIPTATLQLSFIGGNTSANWNVYAFPMFGPIEGV